MRKSRCLRPAVVAASMALLASTVQADADSARNRGAAWLVQHQRGDGSWANADGALPVQATATALLALRNAALGGAPSTSAGAAWLANAGADSVDSIARKVEALALAGLRGAAQTEADRLYGKRAQGLSATWGGYGGNGADHIDTALGLTALRTGDAGFAAKLAAPSNNTIIGALCALAGQRVPVAAGQQAWPASAMATGQSASQARPSVVATALLLGELRAVQLRSGYSSFSCPTAYTLSTILAEAQAWLLSQQNLDGGFGEQRSDGSKGASSVIVSAWVYRALGVQAVPPALPITNARNWLLLQQDASTGSWRGDPLVTAAVVLALPAAIGAQATDTDRDGIPDAVELQLPGSDPAVADARNPLAPPSLAVPGITISAFTAAATVGQPFSGSLGGGSGYLLSLGSLPPGLLLNGSNGLIGGTPQQAGSYSFEATRTLAGSTETLIGRIDVAQAAAVAVDGDVPLPGWALLVLGAGLLGAIRHRLR